MQSVESVRVDSDPICWLLSDDHLEGHVNV